ncbi:MAG TPA: sigma-70 family RNA polymerase sigma factor [Nannocystaceae bacterium]|nr:sigma-70 family RNA polymerase sigma factor [Nannocystaceae bacterium]
MPELAVVQAVRIRGVEQAHTTVERRVEDRDRALVVTRRFRRQPHAPDREHDHEHRHEFSRGVQRSGGRRQAGGARMDVERSTAAALADLQWLRGLAAVVAADVDDADDLVQETLVAAWSKPPIDGDASVRPWLGAVLRNRFRMMVRGRTRRSDRERAAAPTPSASDEPEPTLARLEILRVLIAELEALPADDRDILVRRFFDGQSAADIARALGMPDATVRSKIHRALQRLRVTLDRRFEDRRVWCGALGLPPLVPITKGGGMSIAMKGLLIAGAVTTVGGATWVAKHEPREAVAVVPTQEQQVDTSPRRAWEGRRERIHRALAETPAPVEDATPAIDIDARERDHAIVREQIDACLEDLESEVDGALTLDDVGVIYESISPVAETLRDPEVMECILEGIYAFVGDAPAEPYRRASTWTMQIGDSDDEEVAAQRAFDAIVGAHIKEVSFCAEQNSFAQPWTITMTIGADGKVSALVPSEPQPPAAYLACVTTAVARWKFPPVLFGRTLAYDFGLDHTGDG